MSDTGWIYAGKVREFFGSPPCKWNGEEKRVPDGSQMLRTYEASWYPPLSDILNDDGQLCEVDIEKDDQSIMLELYDFPFNTTNLPNGAQITGVTIRYEASASDSEVIICNSIFFLCGSTQSKVSSNKGDAPTASDFWTTTPTNHDKGGGADKWGITDLAPGDFRKDDGSGGMYLKVRFQCENYESNTDATGYVDVVCVKVHYTT